MNVNITVQGRLGNFIMCVINAIYIALHNNYNVSIPPHSLFKTSYIVLNDQITKDHPLLEDKYGYFYRNLIDCDPNIFQANHDKVKHILQSIFKIKMRDDIHENDLVIHIRSGDIFSEKNPHKEYIQPPLWYYVNIIEKNVFHDIYLIAEDNLNPVIPQLIKMYPKIVFKIQSLEDDIRLILGATNIVSGHGSFIPSLLQLQTKCKNLYSPKPFFLDKINVIVVDMKDYYEEIKEWKNTPDQHALMLNYKIGRSGV